MILILDIVLGHKLKKLKLLQARSDWIDFVCWSIKNGNGSRCSRDTGYSFIDSTEYCISVYRKPTTFATCIFEGKKKLVLGLPGNPVSATVTSHLYVLPAIRKMSGYISPLGTIIKATVCILKCLNEQENCGF
jgi:hypothetical protein